MSGVLLVRGCTPGVHFRLGAGTLAEPVEVACPSTGSGHGSLQSCPRVERVNVKLGAPPTFLEGVRRPLRIR